MEHAHQLLTYSSMSFTLTTAIADAPFSRIWIDGPRAKLALELP